ncbi:MAG: hypothetical protein J7501_11440 [Bdellovibrio sp.]|nr:hypothetical protein [Bdellovibrio sp.]
MKNSIAFLFAALMTVSSAWADGSITLKGKYRSFSSSTVEIFDGKNIYSLDKKQLSKTQLATFKTLKIGDTTEMNVKFSAILSAKQP